MFQSLTKLAGWFGQARHLLEEYPRKINSHEETGQVKMQNTSLGHFLWSEKKGSFLVLQVTLGNVLPQNRRRVKNPNYAEGLNATVLEPMRKCTLMQILLS